MPAGSFKIQIAQETLEDLRRRLARTRWTDEIQGADDWDYGTNLDYLKTLVQYWQDKFDWRAQEEIINRFAHFRTDIEGFGIHFIHGRGRGDNPLPLILTHGFPDSLLRHSQILLMLTDPAAHRGHRAHAFQDRVLQMPDDGFGVAQHQQA